MFLAWCLNSRERSVFHRMVVIGPYQARDAWLVGTSSGVSSSAPTKSTTDLDLNPDHRFSDTQSLCLRDN